VSMLAVTIALLAGASAVAVLSITDASRLVQSSSQAEQRDAGVLVTIVASQANQSGTYVWLYDYGWTSGPVGAVYVEGQPVHWSSTCGDDWTGDVCYISIVPPASGVLTVLVGGVSIAATV